MLSRRRPGWLAWYVVGSFAKNFIKKQVSEEDIVNANAIIISHFYLILWLSDSQT